MNLRQNVDWPNSIDNTTKNRVNSAIARVEELERDSGGPLADDVAVASDPDHGFRIAFQWAGPVEEFLQPGVDYAGRVYDELESAGISRPVANPHVGVQVRSSNVSIEAVTNE